MTEPVYEYVKGKGWIVQTPYLTLHDGVKVRLEFRKPNLGEQYGSFGHPETLKTYLKELYKNPGSYHYELYNTYREYDTLNYNDSQYITLVKIS